jgi:hypothetical protein
MSDGYVIHIMSFAKFEWCKRWQSAAAQQPRAHVSPGSMLHLYASCGNILRPPRSSQLGAWLGHFLADRHEALLASNTKHSIISAWLPGEPPLLEGLAIVGQMGVPRAAMVMQPGKTAMAEGKGAEVELICMRNGQHKDLLARLLLTNCIQAALPDSTHLCAFVSPSGKAGVGFALLNHTLCNVFGFQKAFQPLMAPNSVFVLDLAHTNVRRPVALPDRTRMWRDLMCCICTDANVCERRAGAPSREYTPHAARRHSTGGLWRIPHAARQHSTGGLWRIPHMQ